MKSKQQFQNKQFSWGIALLIGIGLALISYASPVPFGGGVTSALAAPPFQEATPTVEATIEATDVVTCQEDYNVQADDWLSKLADKFYGDVLAYPAIFEATNAAAKTDNSYAAIANADLIEPGWKLCIPSADEAQALLGNGAAASEAAGLTQTSIQLSWVHTIEFAGFYEAADQGLYANEGLEARIDNGGFDDKGEYIDAIQRVVSGQDDFGIVGADVLLNSRAQGQPVVGLAAIYQRNPIVLISLAENNITRPKDLVGRRIGVAPGDELMYDVLLKAENISKSDVIEVPIDTSLEPLINGEVDARTGFITTEPFILRQMGYEVNIIKPSDYGVDLFYSNVIFTTEETIANRPDLVEKFLRATLQGYDAAIADPAHAANASIARDPLLVFDNEFESMEASIPLLKPEGSQMGMMDPKIWESTQPLLLDHGVLSQPVDVNAAYTLSFLQKIYGQ